MDYAFIDVEATSLLQMEVASNGKTSIRKLGSEVVQIGGLLVDSQLSVKKSFCYYCDVISPCMSSGAAEVTGIDLSDIRMYLSGVYLHDIILDHLDWIFQDNLCIVGHNINFDITTINQTLFDTGIYINAPLRLDSLLPKKGRWAIDTVEYTKVGSSRRRLSSFYNELTPARKNFMENHPNLSIETNCVELLEPSWEQAHNSFFDSLETYLLWKEYIWKKKLI